jgi:tetratricopeptide (TPR) repeat protein
LLGQLHRVAVPIVILIVFYAAVFLVPRQKQTDPRAAHFLTAEESQRLVGTAQSALKDRRWKDALADLTKLVERYPNNSNYWWSIAQAHRELGQHEKEVAALEKYWDSSRTRIAACPALSRAYAKAGQDEQALEAARRCYELDRLNSDSVFELAHEYETHGDRGKARDFYIEGLHLTPDHADIHVGLARLDLSEGKPKAAIEHAQRALVQVPEAVDAMIVLGMAYRAEGARSKARTVLEQALTIAEPYADIHFALAGIAADENDIASARRHYTRVVELDPSGTTGREAKDRLKALEVGHP